MLDDGGAMLGEEEATNGVCAQAGIAVVATTNATMHSNHFV